MENYECHVTLEKPDDLKKFEDLAKEMYWKTSFIEGDPLLGNRGFFYFTTHSKTYEDIFSRMTTLCERLGDLVVRKKIEKIVYDTGKSLMRNKSGLSGNSKAS